VTSTCESVPGTSTISRGPSPKTRYARWTSPLFAYLIGASISHPPRAESSPAKHTVDQMTITALRLTQPDFE
jgi:hypothetical protein